MKYTRSDYPLYLGKVHIVRTELSQEINLQKRFTFRVASVKIEVFRKCSSPTDDLKEFHTEITYSWFLNVTREQISDINCI